MLYKYNIIIFLYILIRVIFKLDINIYLEYLFITLFFMGSQLHFISKKMTGLMIGEYPKILLYPWLYLYITSVILFILSIFIDVLKIISIYFTKLNNLLNSENTLMIIFIFSFLASFFSFYQAIKIPKIKEKNIYINNWPKELNGLKIIQLTDLHISSLLSKKWLERVILKVNLENPDLIVITGDFIDGFTNKHKDSITPLSLLKSRLGVYGVTGNHDYYYGFKDWYKEFEKNNVKLLFNEKILIDNSFYLIGIPDIVASNHNETPPDIKKATMDKDNRIPSILLDHRPSNALNNEKYKIDLQLSGHTHGGMIPLLATIVKKKNNGFYSGLYKLKDMQLYISNGTGIWNGFPVRIFYNSEITLLKIYKGD